MPNTTDTSVPPQLFYRAQLWYWQRALRLRHWVQTTGLTPPDTRHFCERREGDERPLIPLPDPHGICKREGLAWVPRTVDRKRTSQHGYFTDDSDPMQEDAIRLLEDSLS